MQCFAHKDIQIDKWGDGQISMYDAKQDLPEKLFQLAYKSTNQLLALNLNFK